MRVLHLVNRIDESGDGITNVSIDLAVEQARAGHEVVLASRAGSYEGLLTSEGVEFVALDFANRRPVATLRTRRQLKQVVRRVRPDVIHVHTLTPAILAASLVGGPPVLATVHNEYQRGAWLMGLADRVVGVSKAVTEAMIARRVPRRRTATVLNGTIGSPRRVDPSTLPRLDLMRPAVVALGAVSHRKGVDILLDAFERVSERVPQAHLYFVGHLDWSEFVESARRSPCASRVHFEGFQAQPQGFLAAADVFVLASRRDPFPLVLLEALEAGCPVVASSADGIPEALDFGKAGLLVPVGDAEALATRLEDVLTKPDVAEHLGAAARDRASQFTVKRMTDDYLALYEELRVENGSR